jgi:hypothetical protein
MDPIMARVVSARTGGLVALRRIGPVNLDLGIKREGSARRYRLMNMVNAHIDISQGLDGEPVVLACFVLGEDHLAASAHAVAAASAERFRTAELAVDDVLELRELTALSDDLRDLALRPGIRTVVLRPARLSAYRTAVAHFVESRDEADWIREEDREPLARVRGLLDPLEDLCADALRAAISGSEASRRS